jgi:UDP-3-O-[3-hydroxymyristoyl] glucosamine N-acyltransferase
MNKVRQLKVKGALLLGLVALLSIGIGVNTHSHPVARAHHLVAFGKGAFVEMNPKTGKVVTVGRGVTITMNVKTGRIVSVNSARG